MPGPKIVVIGCGFAGMAAACCLAQKGYEVTVLEKNAQPGGRARQLKEMGYTFDMGPSWYWMPDVFERFFQKFNTSVADHYQLMRLDPSYQLIFSPTDKMVVPDDFTQLKRMFETIEQGAAGRLEQFIKQGQLKYQAGMQDLVYKPGHNWWEFISLKTLQGIFTLDLLKSFENHSRKYFQNQKILQMLTFPILFLGATASQTPALYSLMNYADMKLGTWYPVGGMYKVVESLHKLALSLGVQFRFKETVRKIEVSSGKAGKVQTDKHIFTTDAVVAAADYHHVETKLIAPEHRQYSENYWQSRTLAPSSLIFYLGISQKISGLLHHNLFFDESLSLHAKEIYLDPKWPTKPLFYVSVTSKTDPSVCPEGHENLFILIPVAPGLTDSDQVREKYYQVVMDRLELELSRKIRHLVTFKKSYAHRDFIADYNAFKGNAYGLANTLRQTAVLKPKIRSKKVKNLFFAGQLTVPGPGVPPALISGQIAAAEIFKQLPH